MNGAVLVGDGGLLPLTVIGKQDDIAAVDGIGIDLLAFEETTGDIGIAQRGAVDVLRCLVACDRVFCCDRGDIAVSVVSGLNGNVGVVRSLTGSTTRTAVTSPEIGVRCFVEESFRGRCLTRVHSRSKSRNCLRLILGFGLSGCNPSIRGVFGRTGPQLRA